MNLEPVTYDFTSCSTPQIMRTLKRGGMYREAHYVIYPMKRMMPDFKPGEDDTSARGISGSIIYDLGCSGSNNWESILND